MHVHLYLILLYLRFLDIWWAPVVESVFPVIKVDGSIEHPSKLTGSTQYTEFDLES